MTKLLQYAKQLMEKFRHGLITRSIDDDESNEERETRLLFTAAMARQ